jgi:hypothetical protein
VTSSFPAGVARDVSVSAHHDWRQRDAGADGALEVDLEVLEEGERGRVVLGAHVDVGLH